MVDYAKEAEELRNRVFKCIGRFLEIEKIVMKPQLMQYLKSMVDCPPIDPTIITGEETFIGIPVEVTSNCIGTFAIHFKQRRYGRVEI